MCVRLVSRGVVQITIQWLTLVFCSLDSVDPDRGRPVEQDDNLDLTAGGAPAATPYTYGTNTGNPVTSGPNEMAEANAYGSGAYPSATGYGAGGAGQAAAYGAAGAGAAGLGAGALYNAGQQQQQQQYYQQSSQPAMAPSASGAGVSRGPSSASALSGSTGGATSTTGATPSSAGAGGITAAAAAKRAEAARERTRLASTGGFAVPEESSSSSGPQGTYQHQDGGRMMEHEDGSDEVAEVPPTYDSIPADRR